MRIESTIMEPLEHSGRFHLGKAELRDEANRLMDLVGWMSGSDAPILELDGDAASGGIARALA